MLHGEVNLETRAGAVAISKQRLLFRPKSRLSLKNGRWPVDDLTPDDHQLFRATRLTP